MSRQSNGFGGYRGFGEFSSSEWLHGYGIDLDEQLRQSERIVASFNPCECGDVGLGGPCGPCRGFLEFDLAFGSYWAARRSGPVAVSDFVVSRPRWA